MDVFNMMFGGGMGGMGGMGRQSNKTKPMVHKMGVSLEELYNGKVTLSHQYISSNWRMCMLKCHMT